MVLTMDFKTIVVDSLQALGTCNKASASVFSLISLLLLMKYMEHCSRHVCGSSEEIISCL
jgi:hypothetical protein